MKLICPMLAMSIAAASIGTVGPSAASPKRVQFSTATQFDEASSRNKHRHVRVYQAQEVYEPPVACSSVRFPRSPLCATVPSPLSRYGLTNPWVTLWSARN